MRLDGQTDIFDYTDGIGRRVEVKVDGEWRNAYLIKTDPHNHGKAYVIFEGRKLVFYRGQGRGHPNTWRYPDDVERIVRLPVRLRAVA